MSLPGPRGSRHRRRLVLLGVVVLCAGWWVQPSAGAVSRPNLEQVRQQVQVLHEQAEAATEKFNDTRDKIASLQVQVSAAQLRLTEQQKAVQKAQQDLGRIAVDTYKAGDLATLSLFFGDDPDRFVQANGLFVSLGDRKAEAVQALTRQRQLLVGGMTDVQEQQQRLQQALADLQKERGDVLAKLSAATALLGRLTEGERGRLGQLQAGDDRTGLADLGVPMPTSGRLTCEDVPIAVPPGRLGKVISYACAQVGAPYQWGADGPKAFDCSGLTMMAWKQAGVDLPHNAAAQAELGTRVPLDRIEPGDLLFFHQPISHEAIYIGHGLMLHAPQTGEVVKIVPVRSDAVAAVRL
ncbi:MAG TPA: C40 family peptidase [Kineosporiaceae bacterium]